MRVDPSSDAPLRIALDKKIPPLPDLPDDEIREADQKSRASG